MNIPLSRYKMIKCLENPCEPIEKYIIIQPMNANIDLKLDLMEKPLWWDDFVNKEIVDFEISLLFSGMYRGIIEMNSDFYITLHNEINGRFTSANWIIGKIKRLDKIIYDDLTTFDGVATHMGSTIPFFIPGSSPHQLSEGDHVLIGGHYFIYEIESPIFSEGT